MKIIINPDKDFSSKMLKAVKDNEGFCPCLIEKTPESKCMCQDFKEQTITGPCHCNLYIKIETAEDIKE